MANAFYAKGREGFASGAVNWGTDDIRVILINLSLYTPNLASHDFLDDIPAGARASVVALSGKTQVDGVLDAADPVFSSVAAGPACGALVFYKHTGVEGTSRLLIYNDTGTGIPVTPNGQNITVALDNGANKIAVL